MLYIVAITAKNIKKTRVVTVYIEKATILFITYVLDKCVRAKILVNLLTDTDCIDDTRNRTYTKNSNNNNTQIGTTINQ